MGVKVDAPHVTAFVTRRLMVQSGHQLADKIRSSMDMFSMLFKESGGVRRLATTKEATDQEIVERLVKKNVATAVPKDE